MCFDVGVFLFCVWPMNIECPLTYWGRVTHICVGEQTIIGSDNDLSPGRRQAIIWTNAGILLIGPLGTNFSENLIEIHTFSFKKMHLKMPSAKWRPFCLGLNVLKRYTPSTDAVRDPWCPQLFPYPTAASGVACERGYIRFPLWFKIWHVIHSPVLTSLSSELKYQE